MINSGVYKIIITVILKFWLHFLLWCWKVKFCSPETIAEKLNVEGCKLRVSGGSRIERRPHRQLIADTSIISYCRCYVTLCLCRTWDTVIKISSYTIETLYYFHFVLQNF